MAFERDERAGRAFATAVERLAGDYDGPAAVRKQLADELRRITDVLLASDVTEEALGTALAAVSDAATAVDAGRTGQRAYQEGGTVSVGGEWSDPLSHTIRTQLSFLDNSPFSGPLHPHALPLRLTTSGERVIATGTFGSAFEGPPGCMHGGYVAALFDELLGFSQTFTPQPGMTARLSVTYRSPTPLHTELRLEAWIDRVEGRKIFARGTLHAGDRLCAEGDAMFLSLRPQAFERLAEQRADVT